MKTNKITQENTFCCFMFFIVIPYITISLFAFCAGMDRSHYKCLRKPVRIQKFVPAYKFGCWAGSIEGEKYYYGQ